MTSSSERVIIRLLGVGFSDNVVYEQPGANGSRSVKSCNAPPGAVGSRLCGRLDLTANERPVLHYFADSADRLAVAGSDSLSAGFSSASTGLNTRWS